MIERNCPLFSTSAWPTWMLNLALIFPLQHDTAPPLSPMCVGFLPPGEPADVSHDQQQAEHGAGESAEPLTQLHLPPGLHLSGEEQRESKPHGSRL